MKSASVIVTMLLLLGSAYAQENAQEKSLPEAAAPSTTTTTANTALAKAVSSKVAPESKRRSIVSLPFNAPAEARELVIAHVLPLGATYLSGSAKLGDTPLPDPLVGKQGQLYWVIAARRSGVVSYEVTYTGKLGNLAAPSLLARYKNKNQASEVLRGKVDEADLAAAAPTDQEAVATENAGSIKLPVDGRIFRLRDRITVVIEAPLDQALEPTINGVPFDESRIGSRTTDSANNKQHLEYVGIPLKPGPNVIKLGNDTITVNYASVTTTVKVTPIDLVADGNSVLRLKLQAHDAYGVLTSVPNLTVKSNLEPSTPDADSSSSGYQIRMTDGVGELVLAPQSAPTTLELSVLVGGRDQQSRFEVRPSSSRVAVGMVSVTLGLPDFKINTDNLTYQARLSLEAPLLGGKLYLAANKDGLPKSESVYQRYGSYGDSSTESTPLQGIDPVAFIYDHPVFRVSYRQAPLPNDVLPLAETFTAVRIRSKNAGPQVAAFAAAVPSDKVSEQLTPEGRLLRLQRGVALDSENLTVVTTDKTTGVELKRVTLARLVDYTLDVDSGVVTLSQALEPLDADLNTVRVDASYRLDNPLAKRKLSYGVQVWQQQRNYAYGAGLVSLDDVLTYGVRGKYNDLDTDANVLAMYSGGVQISANIERRFSKDSAASLQARYQSDGYAGLSPLSSGLSVAANYKSRISERLNVVADGEYHTTKSGQGGSVTTRVDYSIKPFSVGGGLKYAFGDIYGLGAVVSAGYHKDPVDVDVVQTQPLSGNLPATTDVTAKVKVAPNVTVGLRDSYTWGVGHSASLTTDTKLGNVNYAISYELPNASGGGNRARFGADTSIPINKALNLGLRGALVRSFANGTNTVNAGADLRYQGNNITSSVGADVNYQDGKVGTVLRGNVTGSLSSSLTLSADATAEVGRTQGLRASFGYAYRAGDIASLGYLRYANGSLAGNNPEVTAGVSAEYHRNQYAVRAGLDARELLNDTDSLTLQPSLSATAYIGNRFGIGAQGRALIQPGTSSTIYGYGLEGSIRALPGTWLTGGYNFAGFDGIGNAYTKQGAYVRLDVTIDDSILGK